MFERLKEIEARFEELSRLLADPEVTSDHRRVSELARERSQLDSIVALYRHYRETEAALHDARTLQREGDDEERELGREEVARLDPELERLEQELKLALLPRDPAADKDVIVEVRAGTGGEEAAIFAHDLFRMYQRYAERQGWKTEVLNTSEAGPHGYREIVFEVRGQGAYSRLKHESGVHRVQRVPQTEAQGRIHTSTATVAVLPVVDEVEVDMNWSDVRVDIFHSGGAGGQNVNKVATAVRLTHVRTGNPHVVTFDPIAPEATRTARAGFRRLSNNAGGLEGGMTTGEPLVVRVAMKPISTLMSPLRTVDLTTGQDAAAQSERSDVTAVPAAGVIAEALVAIVLADAMLEKFAGDSLTEMTRNCHAFLAAAGRRWEALDQS